MSDLAGASGADDAVALACGLYGMTRGDAGAVYIGYVEKYGRDNAEFQLLHPGQQLLPKGVQGLLGRGINSVMATEPKPENNACGVGRRPAPYDENLHAAFEDGQGFDIY